jgi:hypothetical protein
MPDNAELCSWDAGREQHEWCRRGDAERDKIFQHKYGPAAAAADLPEGTVELFTSCMKGEKLAYVNSVSALRSIDTDCMISLGKLHEASNRLSTLGGEVILDKFRLATSAKDVDTQIAVCLAAESKPRA